MPPFSFREWVRFHHSEYNGILEPLSHIKIDIKDRNSVSTVVDNIVKKLKGDFISFFNGFANDYARPAVFSCER